MMRWSLVVGVILVAGSVAGVAAAQESAAAAEVGAPRLAVRAAERGLTIGEHNLMLGLEPGLLHAGDTNAFAMALPLRFGITEDLEVFAAPVLQSVAPALHEPGMGLTYRFTHGAVEVGARAVADLALVGPTPRHATFQLGVPVRIHAGRSVAIDLGAYLLLTAHPSTYAGVHVPVGVTLNATDRLFLGARSGVLLANFEPEQGSAGDSIAIPLASEIGYTLECEARPGIDVGARVAWDDLRTSDVFTVQAFGRFYFFP